MILNTNEPRTMHFDVNIQGVDYKQLKGSLKFTLEGVEYGFPVTILKDHMEVKVPALDDVIKKGLTDGKTIECNLDILGEGFYMMPWQGKFELKKQAVVEARMSYDEPSSRKPSISDKKSIDVKEPKISKSVVVNETKKELSMEEMLKDGNETENLLTMLEKLVSARLQKEGRISTKIENELSEIDDVEASALSGEDDNKELDIDKGITGKKGKRTIMTEPPKGAEDAQVDYKKESSSIVDKKLSKMNSLVERFLTVDSKSKRVKTTKKPVKRRITEKRKIKPVAKKQKQFIAKEPGQKITKDDITHLFESVGMKSKSTQDRLIERAKFLGGNEIDDIYHALTRILKPGHVSSPFEEYMKKNSS